MRPPCALVVEEALPEIRKRIAKHLYSRGSSQDEIGKLLGVSQAMVSRYMKEEIIRMEALEAFVDGMSRPLSALAETGDDHDLTDLFCTLCSRLISAGYLDLAYERRYDGMRMPRSVCNANYEDRSRIIEELSAAQRYLEGHMIPDLVPAVKINIAGCIKDPSSREDVASFPGRLLEEEGSLRRTLPPTFGSSRHLADILMEAHGSDGAVNSVMNLGYSQRIGSALDRLGVRSKLIRRNEGQMVKGIGRLISEGYRAIADPGDFGIEPCLYLFGSSPLEVASMAVSIQKRIDGSEVI
ncbi:MAG: thiamine-phosphate synthase family protein [Candidatus Thermoplasmatota archaeon]|nr:thiamine-phosphate synthase family protein [Candidatus Thermoplasmatota archaeon]